MRKKVIVSLIIIIMMIMCTFQYSQAETAKTTSKYFYKNETLGIQAYKQINQFKLSLSDKTTLAEGGINTITSSNIAINTKPVEIVFLIDASGSMGYHEKVQIGFDEETGNPIKIDKQKAAIVSEAGQSLVEQLYKDLAGDDPTGDKKKLGIASCYFANNSNYETDPVYEKKYDMTWKKDDAINTIEPYIAWGGTKMYKALKHVHEKIFTTSTDSKKIVIILTDGAVGDADDCWNRLIKMHAENISSIAILVGDDYSKKFIQEAKNHKYYNVDFEDLSEKIVTEIKAGIYEEIVDLTSPEIEYKINNAAIIKGDDKIIMQVDEEIMHGATLQIEYLISFSSGSDMKIKIKDLYNNPLVFNENQKMLTENKTNKQYGWRMKDIDNDGTGELVNIGLDDSGIETKKNQEYQVKLILSAVLTPTVLGNLDSIGNSIDIEFAYGKDSNGDDIWGGNKKDGTPGNSGINTDIKSLDILIIPPTGISDVRNRVEWTLNMIVAVTSILLIIVCIIDYLKEKKKK